MDKYCIESGMCGIAVIYFMFIKVSREARNPTGAGGYGELLTNLSVCIDFVYLLQNVFV